MGTPGAGRGGGRGGGRRPVMGVVLVGYLGLGGGLEGLAVVLADLGTTRVRDRAIGVRAVDRLAQDARVDRQVIGPYEVDRRGTDGRRDGHSFEMDVGIRCLQRVLESGEERVLDRDVVVRVADELDRMLECADHGEKGEKRGGGGAGGGGGDESSWD